MWEDSDPEVRFNSALKKSTWGSLGARDKRSNIRKLEATIQDLTQELKDLRDEDSYRPERAFPATTGMNSAGIGRGRGRPVCDEWSAGKTGSMGRGRYPLGQGQSPFDDMHGLRKPRNASTPSWDYHSALPTYTGENTRSQGVSSSPKKPATFDGTTSWCDYRVQFELVAEMNGWKQDAMAIQLATSLRGKAQSVLSDLMPEQRRCYFQLTKALSARFEPEDQAEMYRAQLKNRVRKRSEQVPELAQDIQKLVRKAYPTAVADTRDRLSRDNFIDALNDGEIEWAVYQGKPSTLEEAAKLALEFESFRMGHRRRLQPSGEAIRVQQEDWSEDENKNSSSDTKLEALEGRLQQLEVQANLNKIENGTLAKSAPARNKIVCWACGKEGHFARECRVTGNQRHGQGKQLFQKQKQQLHVGEKQAGNDLQLSPGAQTQL